MKTVKRQKGPGIKAHLDRQAAMKKSLKPIVANAALLPKVTKPVQSHPLPSTVERLRAIRSAINW